MPNLENSPFADFMKDLDLTGFVGKPDHEKDPLPGGANPEVRLLESSTKDTFVYDLEVGLAHFTTKIDTDAKDASIFMHFPSRVGYFETDEMHDVVTRILDAAYPANRYTPHARVTLESGQSDFDLANYWDGRRYEKALKDQPASLIYFLPNSVFPSFSPRLDTSSYPPFIYGFNRINDEESVEFVRMSHHKGAYLGEDFAQELLERNSGYLGRDIASDSIDLREKLHTLCTAHPQQKIIF